MPTHYDEQHLLLISHIDTLTTAIEDALEELDKRRPNESRVRALLERAIDEVWETPLSRRRPDLIPLPAWYVKKEE